MRLSPPLAMALLLKGGTFGLSLTVLPATRSRTSLAPRVLQLLLRGGGGGGGGGDGGHSRHSGGPQRHLCAMAAAGAGVAGATSASEAPQASGPVAPKDPHDVLFGVVGDEQVRRGRLPTTTYHQLPPTTAITAPMKARRKPDGQA